MRHRRSGRVRGPLSPYAAGFRAELERSASCTRPPSNTPPSRRTHAHRHHPDRRRLPAVPRRALANPWGPGQVIIGWMPCDCPNAQARNFGHHYVSCQHPSCAPPLTILAHSPARDQAQRLILAHYRRVCDSELGGVPRMSPRSALNKTGA
jgi:hypothetical protein